MAIRHYYNAHHEVRAYANRLNALGASLDTNWQRKLTAFLNGVYTMLGGPVIGKPLLTDVIVLARGANIGAGLSFLSLRGRTGTWSAAVTWGEHGVVLDGTQAGAITVPDFRMGTMAVQGQLSVRDGTQLTSANPWSLSNSAGVTTSTAFTAQFQIGAPPQTGVGPAFCYTRQGAGVAVTDGWTLGSFNLWWPVNDEMPHCYVMTNDNAATPALKGYIDGPISMNDNTANVQATSTCTLLTLGAWNTGAPANFTKMSALQAVVLINKVLTQAEVTELTRLMTWLGVEDRAVVVCGDSTSFIQSDPAGNPGPGNDWSSVMYFGTNSGFYVAPNLAIAPGGGPSGLVTLPLGLRGKFRVCNMGINGLSSALALANYDLMYRGWRPGDRFRDSIFISWLGVAAIAAVGETALQLIANHKAIWTRARADGFKIITATLVPNTGYSGPQNTERLAWNAWLRGAEARTYYDKLVEPDLFISQTFDPVYTYDTLHMNINFHRRMAGIFAEAIDELSSVKS